MNLFSRLCHEHLAFNARVLFDLFEDIVRVAPDLVARFMPQFLENIKQVEFKRGVGFDRALRFVMEQFSRKFCQRYANLVFIFVGKDWSVLKKR